MGKKLTVNTRYYRLFPAEGYLGYAFEEYAADMDRAAFLVVDVYGLGFHPDDPVPSYQQEEHLEGARPALAWLGSADHEDRIVRTALLPALNAARDIGMTIIYLNNSAPKIGLRHSEFSKVLKRQLNTDMERMFAEDDVDPKEYHYGDSDHVKISNLLYPRENEYFVRKHVYSGFFDSRLDTALRNLGIETLVCAGLWANVCMAATALDALYRNYRVIWLRDGTLAGEKPEGVATLANTARWIAWFEDVVGYTVTSGEFAAACEA